LWEHLDWQYYHIHDSTRCHARLAATEKFRKEPESRSNLDRPDSLFHSPLVDLCCHEQPIDLDGFLEVISLEIDKAIQKKIVDKIEEDLQEFLEMQRAILKTMMEVSDVERFMRAKRELLMNFVDQMPLYSSTCYFCLIHSPSCNECEYGRIHGLCTDPSIVSDYGKIRQAKNRLQQALVSY